MVQNLDYDCIWRYEHPALAYMRLDRLRYKLSHGVRELHMEICCQDNLPDTDWSFKEAIEQLPFSQFSILMLELSTEQHAFGPLVLHLLQIRPVRKLELNLYRAGQTVLATSIYTNWRDESISLTELEVVKIRGLKEKMMKLIS
ncbi:hypothetical protein EJB05_35072, partial [Eragrostis curvula]